MGLYGGLLQLSCNSQTFIIFICLISLFILQFTGFLPRKQWNFKNYWLKRIVIFWATVKSFKTKIINRMGEQFKIIEYPLILLFVIIGASLLLSTGDFVSIFLSLELQSYGLYILSTIYRNSELATAGGLTYFLLGALSSCFVLLATSLLYCNSGITSLDGLYVVSSLSDDKYIQLIELYDSGYIGSCLVIMSIGFLFKVSAAPFHFWSPDVYDAIPTIVTTFVAIIAKISIFILLLELVYYTSNALLNFKFSWTYTLLISSLLSLIIGTVVGLTQSRIKRLLAYSTISHVGFILLSLSICSIESVQAFLFYLSQYTISNLNIFILLVTIGFSLFFLINNNKEFSDLLDKNYSPIQLITQIKGYFYLNPTLTLSFAITIFSFIGIPPLVGFFGKQMVLSSALDSGYLFMVFIAVLTSVIGAVYYLNIIKQLFFYKPEYKLDTTVNSLQLYSLLTIKNVGEMATEKLNILLSSSLSISGAYLTLILLLFVFTPEEWLSMANILALVLFNP